MLKFIFKFLIFFASVQGCVFGNNSLHERYENSLIETKRIFSKERGGHYSFLENALKSVYEYLIEVGVDGLKNTEVVVFSINRESGTPKRMIAYWVGENLFFASLDLYVDDVLIMQLELPELYHNLTEESQEKFVFAHAIFNFTEAQVKKLNDVLVSGSDIFIRPQIVGPRTIN